MIDALADAPKDRPMRGRCRAQLQNAPIGYAVRVVQHPTANQPTSTDCLGREGREFDHQRQVGMPMRSKGRYLAEASRMVSAPRQRGILWPPDTALNFFDASSNAIHSSRTIAILTVDQGD